MCEDGLALGHAAVRTERPGRASSGALSALRLLARRRVHCGKASSAIPTTLRLGLCLATRKTQRISISSCSRSLENRRLDTQRRHGAQQGKRRAADKTEGCVERMKHTPARMKEVHVMASTSFECEHCLSVVLSLLYTVSSKYQSASNTRRNILPKVTLQAACQKYL